MTMPKFEPVATAMVNQHGTRWMHWKADLAHGTNLHSADQLTEAYEAGKQDQAAELEAARAEIERKMSAGQFVLEQLAAEQATNARLPRDRNLLVEAWNYGQFADDFNQPQSKPIRAAIRRLCEALSTPSDTSALRAHDAAIWRDAMQIAEDSRDKATMSKYSSVPECRAARDMAECLSKAYCHKADAIEKGGE